MPKSCCKCEMSVSRLMLTIELEAVGEDPITRDFCPPCFQEAMALNEEEMAEYLMAAHGENFSGLEFREGAGRKLARRGR